MARQYRATFKQARLRPLPALHCPTMSAERPITITATVPRDLFADRAAMTTNPICDRCHLLAKYEPVTDFLAFA
jgi:hypothetical protein